MSLPLPMLCLLDACPSQLRCADSGYCRERNYASAREYEEGLRACREIGITDPFGSQFGEPTRKWEAQ